VGQQYCKTVTTTAPIEFEVVEWQSVQQLTDEWLAKDPGGVVAVLAPYDSDGNYEPCRKTGFSAHWALLAGLVYTDSSSISIGRNMNDPHVLAFHGNSAHPGIWSAHALLKSNHQLRNVRPSVLAEAKSTGGYILPAPNGHELSALCGKVVLVKHL
jgi:hypothetical protein